MRPGRITLSGRTVRLEPIGLQHAETLFEACVGQEHRFHWLSDYPPRTLADLQTWIQTKQNLGEGRCFAVVDLATGRAEGRQSLVRVDAVNRVAEIGSIYWGPAIARHTQATEAFYLLASYVFDELGYRRLEWKMNNLNELAHRAARRFGFTLEGVFRQHMIQKGRNRDSAWYSIIDSEWPAVREHLETWLREENFTPDGRQITRLER